MISIAPPPVARVPRRRPTRPAGLNLDAIAFFGRSFSEYLAMFALDLQALKRRPVLDVAAGPSSFTAEASRLGVDAVAVDPMYADRPEIVAARIRSDYDRMQERMRERADLFRVDGDETRFVARPSGRKKRARFESIDAAVRDRRLAAQRFLEDFESPGARGRYFGAALPQLPFLDHTFDVVLCGHLLFLHTQQLDEDFHLKACRELVRVSRDEVRIHPVCGPDGRESSLLPRVLAQLREEGIRSELLDLDHEFFVGANRTLVLRRA